MCLHDADWRWRLEMDGVRSKSRDARRRRGCVQRAAVKVGVCQGHGPSSQTATTPGIAQRSLNIVLRAPCVSRRTSAKSWSRQWAPQVTWVFKAQPPSNPPHRTCILTLHFTRATTFRIVIHNHGTGPCNTSPIVDGLCHHGSGYEQAASVQRLRPCCPRITIVA